MAINDLTNSLKKLLGFLKRSNEILWFNRITKQYNFILKAFEKKDFTSVQKHVETIKTYFGGMGSLNDILICRANKNVPKGFTQIMADRKLQKLLDDAFMWCFFWNIETNNAKRIYTGYLTTYSGHLPPRKSRSSSNIERYIKKSKVPVIYKK